MPSPCSILSSSILDAPTNGVTPDLRDHMFRITDALASLESYGMDVLRNLKVTEMSLLQKEEEPGKVESKMVFETRVTKSMLNDTPNMHGGCTAFLIDFCSSVTLALLLEYMKKPSSQVSQNLNIMYHAPAREGARIRIVNRTVTVGKRTMSARSEVYDADNSRLVASGSHSKMTGSQPETRLKADPNAAQSESRLKTAKL
ncbi:HotDog domain-containing protein [Cristinia sonorae]|uniref:HotDog domain-containing protein n=1 Tax=Cristinia sonorae TaxID=1940300 RepID=A0A8K0UJR2_9AGAR|nr:HotDog domain-containing protein [Cristinia sonorae]